METDIYHIPVSHAEIRRELYSLMAMLFADEKMGELAMRQKIPASREDSFVRLSNDVIRTVLPLKFLTVAAAVRGALDNIADKEPSRISRESAVCGKYRKAHSKDKKENLSLREACNKAIHAKKTLFYQKQQKVAQPSFAVFNGKIMLYGAHQNPKHGDWEAEIDLEKFAAACLVALKGQR